MVLSVCLWFSQSDCGSISLSEVLSVWLWFCLSGCGLVSLIVDYSVWLWFCSDNPRAQLRCQTSFSKETILTLARNQGQLVEHQSLVFSCLLTKLNDMMLGNIHKIRLFKLTWSLNRAVKRSQPIRILGEEQSTKGKDLAWIPGDHLDNYLSRSDTTQCDPGRGWTKCRRWWSWLKAVFCAQYKLGLLFWNCT